MTKFSSTHIFKGRIKNIMQHGFKWLSAPPSVLRRGVGEFGGGGSGGGHVRPDCESAGLAPESADPTWRQIDLLRQNWEEKRSRRPLGGRQRWRQRGGGGGDGDDLPRRTTQQLAWRERTTRQSTKSMETTKVVKTRTVNARVKARSGVCEWVDCCCCCFRSSWDRRTRRFKWPLSPSHRRRRAAAVVPHEVPVQPDRSRPERWCQRPYDHLIPPSPCDCTRAH